MKRLITAALIILSIFTLNAEDKKYTREYDDFFKEELLVSNDKLTGFIGSKEVALQVGEIILKSFYGDEIIEEGKPLTCTLRNGIYYIKGQPLAGKRSKPPFGCAYIKLRKSDGTILGIAQTVIAPEEQVEKEQQ